MAFSPLDPLSAEVSSLFTVVQPSNTGTTNQAAQQILDTPRTGHITREMLTWRTPHLGYVKMYLNPQQLVISEAKDITSTRTKGGFVVQYAGEQLTEISINGSTGSGGIEAINILQSVYRAEQEAFEGIASALEERLSVLQTNTLTGLTSVLDPNLFMMANDALRNFGRPQPTLASLASNIELFFQGALYRGYFTKFGVTESAESPGIFTYTIGFTAYAKQGVRRNFMPWHRQPVNPANTVDSGANQLSFPDVANTELGTVGLPQFGTAALPPLGTVQNLPSNTNFTFNANTIAQKSSRSRSTGTAAGADGSNLTGTDLRVTRAP